MRKRMRDGKPPRLFLQSIITNRGGGNQRFLKIALFKNVELPMSMVCPYTCIAISLQLQPHLQLIFLGIPQHLLFRHLYLLEGTFQVLDVMADLMRQYISLGEVARCTMFVLQILEEAKINIDLLIFRAIERPHAGAGWPTSTVGRATVEYKDRGGIALPGLGEHSGPDSLCIRQHGFDKGGLLVVHFFINDSVAVTTQERRQIENSAKISHRSNPQNGKAKFGTQ